MTLSAFEKKFVILSLLSDGDRIVRQRPEGMKTDAAWMLRYPQSSVWISTVKWLERHGLIAESISPVQSSDDERRRIYYQSELKHRIYAITQKGFDWFLAS